MPVDLRIYDHHRLEFDRGDQVGIRYRGKSLKGFTREPVAVALYAAGIKALARSLKYHRPRGAFCFSGSCNSCRMRIDGLPHQRACKILCSDGLEVEDESGVPGAQSDLMFASDFVFPNKLEYHHIFLRPAPLNRLFASAVERFAASAGLPDEPKSFERIEEERVDLLIIGAGASGLALARLVAEPRKPLVVESHFEAGGRLLIEGRGVESPWGSARTGAELARRWVKDASEKGARFYLSSDVVGFAEEGCWLVRRPDRLSVVWAETTVVATGAYDQPGGFVSDDLPGIVSARGLRRLVNYWGVCPAVRAFVLGSGIDAFRSAQELSEIGVKVMGIAESSSHARCEQLVSPVGRLGIRVFFGYAPSRAIGRFHLKGIEIAPSSGIGERLRFASDLIVVDEPLQPAYELLAQAGVGVRFDSERGRFLPELDSDGMTGIDGLYALGEVTGIGEVSSVFKQVDGLAQHLVRESR